ncbi:MAG: TRAP transporter substrate-binding protein, partial [Chloroflexi bacterium]|nr:TRAP transporter substrate-binding protein [Chloroflexota bacterium]
APAAQPAKPAAQPAKPAAQPAKPAAQPAKPAARTIELRSGCTNPKGTTACDGMDKFIELVKDKSKGELLIRNFYQALGIEQQLTQQVMSGTVDMGTVTTGNAARFTDAYLNWDLPFLFKSYDNMLKATDSPLGRKAIEQFEKDLGVKMLFPLSLGSGRDIQTRNKQLKTPADVRGLKIRTTSSPVEIATYKAWGANPTPLDFGQLLTALQQGTVDGMGIDTLAILSTKMYEATKHSAHLGYQMAFLNYFVNAKKFASLSPEHQKFIVDAAREAQAWHYKDVAARVDKAEDELKRLGVTFSAPTPQEYAQWAAVRDKVWQEAAEQHKGKIDLTLAKQMYDSQP